MVRYCYVTKAQAVEWDVKPQIKQKYIAVVV